MTEQFRVDVVVEGDRQRVAVHGELDMATAPTLLSALEERTAVASSGADRDGLVVIDLTRCDFIDSSGVRAIVQCGQQCRDAGRGFAIVCPPGSGSRFTLDLLGVETSFTLVDDVDDLLADDGSAESA